MARQTFFEDRLPSVLGSGERTEDPQSPEGALGTARLLAVGVKGGSIATAVMTLFRMPISRSPPPTAHFWAKFVAGGDPDEHLAVGLGLHFLYGIGGGVAFTSLLSRLRPGDTEVEDEVKGVSAGLAFGLALSFIGSRILLERVLDMDLEPHERFVFHVSHVIYGLTLGAWCGSNA